MNFNYIPSEVLPEEFSQDILNIINDYVLDLLDVDFDQYLEDEFLSELAISFDRFLVQTEVQDILDLEFFRNLDA